MLHTEVWRQFRELVLTGFTAALATSTAQAQEQESYRGNPASTTRIQRAADAPKANSDAATGYPKISFDTLASVDLSGLSSSTGPDRGPGATLWSDSTFLVEFNDTLSLAGLLQVKPRAPLPADDPNKDLFINRGPGRKEGGKMKELYLRYGNWRVGKFVPDFGRAYALLPGPYSSDFIEEPEQGYEPSDMLGVEKIHVFNNENGGWRQLSVTAFMVDRTFLHESFPYNEGIIHLGDGGVGNTRFPENISVTYDVLNQRAGHWGHLSYQAGVIRWGKSVGEERGEWWSTLGADLSIPLNGSVADTLSARYSQFHFYVEAARRDNFKGIAGRTRQFLSGSAEYMRGPLVFDLTTAHRWTTDRILPLQKDASYTATIAYTLPSQTILSLSAAHETVGAEKGFYTGLRVTHTFTTCSKCIARGSYY